MAPIEGSLRALVPRDGGLFPPDDVRASWPKPNYVNPETRDWTAPIVLITVCALTCVVYAARMWARLRIARNGGLDDILMSVAMIHVVGCTVAVVFGIKYLGFQWHIWDQLPITITTIRQISMAIELLYFGGIVFIKISILFFYRRLASQQISRAFVWWVRGAICSVILYALIFALVIIFSYSPAEAYWRVHDPVWLANNDFNWRLDEGAIIVSLSVISTLQDFAICALPAVLVRNLQIHRRQKIGLMAIFGLGLLTCICGIMRTYYSIYIYYYTYDITWYGFYAWIWTALEADLGVVCASAPALRVLFRRYFAGSSTNSAEERAQRNAARAGDLEMDYWTGKDGTEYDVTIFSQARTSAGEGIGAFHPGDDRSTRRLTS